MIFCVLFIQIAIDSVEKDKQHLQEQLAGVRAEKDALEAVLFDTANMLEDADNKRSKLEHELQDTLLQQENLKGSGKIIRCFFMLNFN